MNIYRFSIHINDKLANNNYTKDFYFKGEAFPDLNKLKSFFETFKEKEYSANFTGEEEDILDILNEISPDKIPVINASYAKLSKAYNVEHYAGYMESEIIIPVEV